MTADGLQPTFVEDPFCTGINSYAQVSNNFFEGTRKRQYLTSFLGRDAVLGKVKTRCKTDRKACANYVTSEANHAPITMWSFVFSPFTWVFFRGLFWYTCHEGSFGDSMKTPSFIINNRVHPIRCLTLFKNIMGLRFLSR